MQHQAIVVGGHLGRGVQRVAHDGVANGLQVHTQLMRAAGERLQQQPRGRLARIALQHAVAGHRGLAADVINDLPRPLRPVGGQRQVDLAVGLLHKAFDQRFVVLGHLARFEQRAELALHRRASGKQQQTRSCHVEPMHGQRVGKLGLHPGAGVVGLVGTPAGHRQQSGGLVDDHQRVVRMHDQQRAARHARMGVGLVCRHAGDDGIG